MFVISIYFVFGCNVQYISGIRFLKETRHNEFHYFVPNPNRVIVMMSSCSLFLE